MNEKRIGGAMDCEVHMREKERSPAEFRTAMLLSGFFGYCLCFIGSSILYLFNFSFFWLITKHEMNYRIMFLFSFIIGSLKL